MSGPSEEEIRADAVLDSITQQINLSQVKPINTDTIKTEYDGKDPTFIYPEQHDHLHLQEQLVLNQLMVEFQDMVYWLMRHHLTK